MYSRPRGDFGATAVIAGGTALIKYLMGTGSPFAPFLAVGFEDVQKNPGGSKWLAAYERLSLDERKYAWDQYGISPTGFGKPLGTLSQAQRAMILPTSSTVTKTSARKKKKTLTRTQLLTLLIYLMRRSS